MVFQDRLLLYFSVLRRDSGMGCILYKVEETYEVLRTKLERCLGGEHLLSTTFDLIIRPNSIQ